MVRIAVDMMGGDLGVNSNVEGLGLFCKRFSCDDVAFDLYGNFEPMNVALSKVNSIPHHVYEIHDTGDRTISSNDRPSSAIKRGGGTSMFEAISRVALGHAHAVVSSGNTGAYMALSKIILGVVSDISRPALVGIMPTVKGRSVMLDLGANTECSATQLSQFSAMGSAVAKILFGIEFPSVALLNMGTERSKGTETLDEAYKILEKTEKINFIGFVEGTDITTGKSDVIVADGFTGNIALKTMEGTIRYLMYLAKEELKKSFISKIGYVFCRGMMASIRNSLDPRHHNGAPLVGLKKIAIKSHGGADALGFANAISVAVTLAKSNFVSNVVDALGSLKIDKTP